MKIQLYHTGGIFLLYFFTILTIAEDSDEKPEQSGNYYFKVRLELHTPGTPVRFVKLTEEFYFSNRVLLSFRKFDSSNTGELKIYETNSKRFGNATAILEGEKVSIIAANHQPAKVDDIKDFTSVVDKASVKDRDQLKTQITSIRNGYYNRVKDGVSLKMEVIEFDQQSEKFANIDIEKIFEEIENAWEHHVKNRANWK